MTSNESGFQLKGTGPEAYERYMVPIHCLTRAEDLIDRVSLQPGEHVLDVACGTGIVSRYAARRVGYLGHVTGVELNPAMLQIAREVSAYVEQIKFLEGSALDLPVSDSQFDVVLCQQAIMFFPDRHAAAREMYRALKPGGRVGLNVWRTPEFNPAFDHLITALEKHAGAEAGAFMRSPFIMKSVAEMRSFFEQAGFSDISVINRIDTLRYPSVEHLVRYETLNIPDPEIHKKEMQEALIGEMNRLVEAYIDDHGVAFPVQDFVVVARR
ncbi:MAG: class I SAM-dependent methyltransferase [Gammaproteobacteria bacterium]|nr:class I SAM-dependent methyltransferase [Gammaproteobacteria bacterium]